MKYTALAALAFGLLAAACGGSDAPAGDGTAGSDTGSAGKGNDGSAGKATGGTAGEDQTGTGDAGESAGGTTNSAGSSNAAGSAGKSAAAGASSAGSSSSGDCDLDTPVVSCYVDTGGGTALCSETALEGTSADYIESQCGGKAKKGEHCPMEPNLVGYCKGGISSFYYAPDNNPVFTNIGSGCTANGGKWCAK